MPTDLLAAYGKTLTFLDARVAATADDQFANPTPCSDWDAASLFGHLTTVLIHYTALALGQSRAPIPADPTFTCSAYRDAFPTLTAAALSAWAQPGAMDRPCHHVMGVMPGSQALSIHLADVLLHGWDLSVATGQDDTIDPALADLAGC